MMGEQVIVRMRHLRKIKMCSHGGRAFAARHGFEWSDFLKNGIPAERLIATDDAMALKAVEAARGK